MQYVHKCMGCYYLSAKGDNHHQQHTPGVTETQRIQ